MSNQDDEKISLEDDLFVKKARASFDDSVAGLDGQAQSKLNRSRQAALAKLDGRSVSLGRWTQWAPVAGAAAVAVVAVVMLNGNPALEPAISPTLTQSAGDFELLMAEDSFDMLQDLEFYSWVDIEVEFEAGTGTDVG